MLIRFSVKNLFSFNEATEFNLFPNKTQRLPHHKVKINDDISVLRFGAIYGANGIGKSNLIKGIGFLQEMIKIGNLVPLLDTQKFRLYAGNEKEPISWGIEFFYQNKIYYYTISVSENIILYEGLFEGVGENEKLIFERIFEDNKQKITFFEKYTQNPKNKMFVELLEEKLVEKNQILLSFLSEKFEDEEDFFNIINAYKWIRYKMTLVSTQMKMNGMPQLLDKNKDFKKFCDSFFHSLDIGIQKIYIDKIILNKNDKEHQNFINKCDENGGFVCFEDGCIKKENNKYIFKRLFTEHLDNKNEIKRFFYKDESDGTQRLFDFVPLFYDLLREECTILVDEIERSIHPLLIKKLIEKIALAKNIKGQLIFTTHETHLLDQNILRPDEIWLVEKDQYQATKLSPLSDYNIHNTANIENGYLQGRYSGVPFLGNLKDLNW